MKFSRQRHRESIHDSSYEALTEIAIDLYTDTGLYPEFNYEYSIESMKERYFRHQHYMYYMTCNNQQIFNTFYIICAEVASDAMRQHCFDRHGNFCESSFKDLEKMLDEMNRGFKGYCECVDAAVEMARDLNMCLKEENDPDYIVQYYDTYIYCLAEYHAMHCHKMAGLPSFVSCPDNCVYLTYNEHEKHEVEVIKKTYELPQKQDGYVYLIGSLDSMFFKIGISKNPQSRLKALQTSNPTPLEIITACKCSRPSDEESKLHALYSKHRQQGEWFKFTGDMLGKCIKQIDGLAEAV